MCRRMSIGRTKDGREKDESEYDPKDDMQVAETAAEEQAAKAS